VKTYGFLAAIIHYHHFRQNLIFIPLHLFLFR